MNLVNSQKNQIFAKIFHFGKTNKKQDMKKKILSVFAGIMCAACAYAVPAMPGKVKTTQPDGSTVTVQLIGDEFFSSTITADGYTVQRNDAGYLVYVNKVDGKLVQTSIVAHDADSRTAEEKQFLSSIPMRLADDEAIERGNNERLKANNVYVSAAKSATPKRYDYKNFRGLVILCEFSDRSFSRDDIAEVFTNLVTQRNYKGVPSPNDPNRIISEYTGSVRDYFYDNSCGVFDPQFDVVGPVKVNRSCEYPKGSSFTDMPTLIKEVLAAADPLVNFKNYDGDGDGYVDMFYVVFAGYGSNFYGNNSNYVWPHASVNYKLVDGVCTQRYACSTELYGYESEGLNVIDGIGTICHEFSHVLGTLDEYDIDYDGSGGQSFDPGIWSIMASGSYLNNGRTPCGLSAFQRYQSGFAMPQVITGEGDYELAPTELSGAGIRLNSAVDKEYFMFENRRLSDKWNKYLPGEGMLVFRVDSTSVSPWMSNKLNANPAHNYYEMVRAVPNPQKLAWASDPFPGAGKVTKLTNHTSPTLKSWAGKSTPYVISNITEAADGTITLSVVEDVFGEKIEDFESFDVFTGGKTGVEGNFATWDFTNAEVTVTPNTSGTDLGNGTRTVKIKKNGCLAMTTEVWSDKVVAVKLKAWNNSLSKATLHVSMSVDCGATWTEIFKEGTTVASEVKSGNAGVEFSYPVETDSHVMFKIESTATCYIDDITIEYEGKSGLSAVEDVVADAAADGLAVIADGSALRVYTNGEADVEVYSAGGVLVSRSAGGAGSYYIELPQRGFYIVRQGEKTRKVLL